MKADDKTKIICFFYVEVIEYESKNYSLLFFSEKDSELLYNIYEGDTIEVDYSITFKSLYILQFEVKPLKETTMPLAIDFVFERLKKHFSTQREIVRLLLKGLYLMKYKSELLLIVRKG